MNASHKGATIRLSSVSQTVTFVVFSGNNSNHWTASTKDDEEELPNWSAQYWRCQRCSGQRDDQNMNTNDHHTSLMIKVGWVEGKIDCNVQKNRNDIITKDRIG